MAQFDYLKTKDQMGRPDSTGLLVKKVSDAVKIDDRPLIVERENIGNSWIVGHARNGLVGANTNTIGGDQQVVGSSGRVNTLLRVVNRNNIFYERFINELLKSTPFTSDWDTTNQILKMDSSSIHTTPYNTIATIGPFYKNLINITSVQIIVNENKWNENDQILYYVSADDKVNFQQVTNNTKTQILNIGQVGWVKIVFAGNGGADTYIDELKVIYNV